MLKNEEKVNEIVGIFTKNIKEKTYTPESLIEMLYILRDYMLDDLKSISRL